MLSSREATPNRLRNQIDEAIGGHRTSSAIINGGKGMSTKGETVAFSENVASALASALALVLASALASASTSGNEDTSH